MKVYTIMVRVICFYFIFLLNSNNMNALHLTMTLLLHCFISSYVVIHPLLINRCCPLAYSNASLFDSNEGKEQLIQ